MTHPARLDRQLRIPHWNQDLLARAQIGVVGEGGLLTSLYILSAMALGINHLRVVAPRLDERLLSLGQRLNPDCRLSFFQGYYTHPVCREIFLACHLIIDLSGYSLAGKILLEQAFHEGMPVVRGGVWQEARNQGFRIFTYLPGREWQELQQVLTTRNLPQNANSEDGVLEIIAAGLILEETKNILMQNPVSPELITYQGLRPTVLASSPRILIAGAGALGNFVGLGLALTGFSQITFMDPDVIEVTNLNRQVCFADAVGASKAEVLAARLNSRFHTSAHAVVDYFREETDISGYDVVFDCVDNFASRIALSEACAGAGTILVSGGTGIDGGQVVVFHPNLQPQTPAAVLGFYDIAASDRTQGYQRERAACIYRPDPSVIMSNQIIGGFMVEAGRKALAGEVAPPLFYQAEAAQRFTFMQ